MKTFFRHYATFLATIVWTVAASIQAYAAYIATAAMPPFLFLVLAGVLLVVAYFTLNSAIRSYKTEKHYDRRLREYEEACKQDAEIAAASRLAASKTKELP